MVREVTYRLNLRVIRCFAVTGILTSAIPFGGVATAAPPTDGIRQAIYEAQVAQQTHGLVPPQFRRNAPVPPDVIATQRETAARELALHYSGRRLQQILPVIQGQITAQQMGTVVGLDAGVSSLVLQKVAIGSLGAQATGKVTIRIKESIRSKNGSVRSLYQPATLLFSDQLSLGKSGYRVDQEWMTNLPNTAPVHNPRLPYGDLHGTCTSANPVAVVRAFYGAVAKGMAKEAQACLVPRLRSVGINMRVTPPWDNVASLHILSLKSRSMAVKLRPGNLPKPYRLNQVVLEARVRWHSVATEPNGHWTQFIYVVKERTGSPWRIAATGSGL